MVAFGANVHEILRLRLSPMSGLILLFEDSETALILRSMNVVQTALF